MPTHEFRPRYVTAPIGFPVGASSAALLAGFHLGLEVRGQLAQLGGAAFPIVGLIENQGDADMVISFEQSTDNGKTDAYAAINVRIGGSAVASVTVKPKGRVQFALETLTKTYLKVKGTGTGWGRVMLCHWAGELVRRESVDV